MSDLESSSNELSESELDIPSQNEKKKRKISEFIEDQAELDDPDNQDKEDDEDDEGDDDNADVATFLAPEDEEEEKDDVVSDDEDDDYQAGPKTRKLKKKSDLEDEIADRNLILDAVGVHRPDESDVEEEKEDYNSKYQGGYSDEEDQAYAVQTSEESDELGVCRRIFGDDIVAYINNSLTVNEAPIKQKVQIDQRPSPQETLEKVIISQDIPERILRTMSKRTSKSFDEKIDITLLEIEASWIFEQVEKSILSSRSDVDITRDDDIVQITQFLSLYCNDRFEVPYIHTYHHNKVSNIDRDILYHIIQLHEDYLRIEIARQNILDFFPSLLSGEDLNVLQTLLSLCSSYDDIMLIDKQFRVYKGFTSDSNKPGRVAKPSKHDLYSSLKSCLENSIDQIILAFMPPLFDMCQQLDSIDNDIQVPNPDQPPELFYPNFVNLSLLSGLSVSRACRTYLQLNLLNNFNLIQYTKKFILQFGEFNTYPTELGAKEFQDTFHELFGYHRLREKPLSTFTSETYLVILDGERRNLIRQEIDVKKDLFHEKLKRVLCNTDNPEWNLEREDILTSFEARLLKKAEGIVRKELYDTSVNYLCDQCNQELTTLIYTQPFLTNSSSPFVMVVYLTSDMQDTNYFLILNKDGMEIDSACFIRKKQEDIANQFESFVRHYLPSFIGLNTSMGMNNTRFEKTFTDIIEKIRNSPYDETQNNDNSDLTNYSPEMQYVSDRSCMIFAETQKGRDEFPQFDKNHRSAISMGRYILDPLVEVCRLWDDKIGDEPPILSFTVYKYQHLIPKDRLKMEWEIMFQDFVSDIGFQFTDYPHLSDTLQFIPGMGFLKAQSLLKELNSIKHNSSDKITRQYLLKKGLLKPIVFDNAAPYIRLPNGNPLDKTRIHPDNYNLAASVCATALGKSANTNTAEEDVVRATKVIWGDQSNLKKEGQAILDRFNHINWEDFTSAIVSNFNEDIRHIILMIEEELKQPYNEKRNQYQPINPEKLFYLLADETDNSLQAGMLVHPVVKMVNDKSLTCFLENGVRCIVDHHQFSDNKDDFVNQSKNLLDQTIHGIIHKIDHEHRFIQLTTKRSELIKEIKADRVFDDNFKQGLDDIEIELRERQLKKQPVGLLHRSIAHDYFKNINIQTALSELDKQSDGSFLFRPSSKGVNYISITYKICDGQYNHFSVEERKKPSPESLLLGADLYLEGRVYHDLDEIIGKFLHKLTAFYNQVRSHRYYYDGPKTKCDAYVEGLKIENQSSIPYRLCIDKDSVGYIIICYVPGTHHHHRYLKINGYGFQLEKQNENKYYTNITELIHRFKQELHTSYMNQT